MKSNILSLAILLSSLFLCAAKQPEPLPSYGLLWKITGNGLVKPSYLFGTFHGRGGMQILDSIKDIDSIFNSTDQLLCESKVNFATRNNPEYNYQATKLERLLKPWPVADSTYENILSKSEKKILDSVLLSDKFLTYMKQFNDRPFGLFSSIRFSYSDLHKKPAMKVSKDYKSNDTTHVLLDLYLVNRAMKRNMKIIELDRMEEYKRIMDSLYCNLTQISYDSEADLLMFYIENHTALDSTIKVNTANSISAYLRQDIHYLSNQEKRKVDKFAFSTNPIMVFLNNEYSDNYRKLIIDERNKNWMKSIPKSIAEKSSFIAVGAAHLAGKNGLINQLRDLGYDVSIFKKE